MKPFSDAAIAAAVCGLIILFIRFAGSLIVMPVKTGKGLEIFTVLKVSGSAPELEQALRSLDFLKDDGKMTVIILDKGMDEETRKIAGISARDKNWITICGEESFADKISEII